MKNPVVEIFDYHEATKHRFEKYARGPGRLDWSSQPDPFRRYSGAPVFPLVKLPFTGNPSDGPSYDAVLGSGRVTPVPVDRLSISRLFYDSMAISSWKSAGGEAWALRVNPSSGNLHPTESYLISGPLPGFWEKAMVCHYSPKDHILEVRRELPLDLWQELAAPLPPDALFVGLTSIHWREAWKYGERAYRYCQLDVGHAVAAISIAAAGMGWEAKLWDSLGTGQLGELFGVADSWDAEPEEPDSLIGLVPCTGELSGSQALEGVVFRAPGSGWAERLRDLQPLGRPNRLSRSHVRWTAIEEAAEASRKPPLMIHPEADGLGVLSHSFSPREIPLRSILHQRRSAVSMDGKSAMPEDVFYRMLSRTLPEVGRAPLGALPWLPKVHLALFVHRVDGMLPGLYFFVRDPRRTSELKSAMRLGFLWQKPENCPDNLPLFLLAEGNVQEASSRIACFQDIAGGGCFSAGMISEFSEIIQENGAWFYPRLFWECGMIGQVFYLEAQAAGLRGTGIGCFFDDAVHEVLGLRGNRYQDLYHFTVGKAVEDERLTTLPAYPEEDR